MKKMKEFEETKSNPSLLDVEEKPPTSSAKKKKRQPNKEQAPPACEETKSDPSLLDVEEKLPTCEETKSDPSLLDVEEKRPTSSTKKKKRQPNKEQAPPTCEETKSGPSLLDVEEKPPTSSANKMKRQLNKEQAPPTSEETKSDPMPKRNRFERLFSEDDEITILKGLSDLGLGNEDLSLSNINKLISYFKNSLQVQVNNIQLKEKIRKLKRQYLKKKIKVVKKTGRPSVSSSNSHKIKVYEMSKQIWGTATTDQVAKKEENGGAKCEFPFLMRAREQYPMGLVGLALIEKSKAMPLEKSWEKFLMEESKVYAERLGLISDGSKLILAALQRE